MFSPAGKSRIDPARFGRRPAFVLSVAADRARGVTIDDDTRLFAMSFLGGLVFMAVYLA